MNETQPSVITESFAQESQERMRFMHFRPWYEDRKVLLGGAGAEFGSHYASSIAGECHTVSEGFQLKDTESHVLMSVPNWQSYCQDHDGKQFAIGGSAENYGSFSAFKAEVESFFGDTPIEWLSQSSAFPYRLHDGSIESAPYWVAVIGSASTVHWPSLALVMPTVDSPKDVQEAAISYLTGYPGILKVIVVSNGSSPETAISLRETAAAFEDVEVIFEPHNLGYGQGCNRGIDYVLGKLSVDLVGVTNDDVIADPDCLPELVWGLHGLEAMGFNPGAIGPVSNSISGRQQVDIGQFESYNELESAVHTYRQTAARSVTQVRQLRGLLLLFTPELLNAIGGFDPRFGIGNFEDDDHNLRAHLAGFSLWIADGAFLFHRGSQTFRKLKIDYESNIRRNAETLIDKWQLSELDQWPTLQFVPRNVTLHVPFDSWKNASERPTTVLNGESISIVDQASDDEFVQWLLESLEGKPRSIRAQIVQLLQEAA